MDCLLKKKRNTWYILRIPYCITNYQRMKSDNALFTSDSLRTVGANWKGKAALTTHAQKALDVTLGQGGSSQLAEVKPVQLDLNVAE